MRRTQWDDAYIPAPKVSADADAVVPARSPASPESPPADYGRKQAPHVALIGGPLHGLVYQWTTDGPRPFGASGTYVLAGDGHTAGWEERRC